MSIKTDINKLIPQPAKNKLPDQPAAASIDAKTGVASFPEVEADNGSGIDSPLTEVSRVTVEQSVTDATGVFTVLFNIPVSITMTDASDRTVIFNYDEP